MITLSRKLKVAETSAKAARDYAAQLNLEINELKAKNAALEKDNRNLSATADSFRLIAGGRFMFSAKDLKPGLEVIHQTNVDSRIITQRPDGKFELLFVDSSGKWASSAMGIVDSIQDVYKYMKKSNYLLKD